jgi:hypothetical protein
MSYTAALLVPTATAALTRIDGGGGPAKFVIKTSGGTVLANLLLTNPAGSVSGAGVLTLTSAGPETNAPAGGIAALADLVDGAGVVLAANLPVQQGSAPVAGRVVISSTTILAGGTVSLVSAVIG